VISGFGRRSVRSWRTKGFRYCSLQSNHQSTISPCSSVVLTKQHAVTHSFAFGCFIFELHFLVWEWARLLLCETYFFPLQSPCSFLSYLFIIPLLYLWLFNDVAGSSGASYGFDSVVCYCCCISISIIWTRDHKENCLKSNLEIYLP
jgi:hypothetical protein